MTFADMARSNANGRRPAHRPQSFMVKFKRAARRQALAFSITCMSVLIAAAAYVYFAHDFSPVLIASLIGVALTFGFVIAASREIWREAIDFKVLAKRVSHPVIGAAPELTDESLRQLAPDARSPLGALAFQPASPFAAAFRELQESLPNQTCVAFLSALPGEGTTTAVLGAGVSATQQGRQVVVVDCDIRQRALTKALGFDPQRGIVEACADPAGWQSCVQEEPETGLHCIPAARSRLPWRAADIAHRLPALIEALRPHYDLIILDCPPALATAEGGPLARAGADRIILVTSWDDTPLTALGGALRTLRGGHGRQPSVGIYVNRAPPVRA